MKYSKAFKEKAVKKVLQMRDTQSMGTIAKELNIPKATLYTWVKNTSNSRVTDGVLTLANKLQILKRATA
ncbi:MAG: transposase [Sulfurimonas sp.]|nr:transposase [Sulfurimonas sp.]